MGTLELKGKADTGYLSDTQSVVSSIEADMNSAFDAFEATGDDHGMTKGAVVSTRQLAKLAASRPESCLYEFGARNVTSLFAILESALTRACSTNSQACEIRDEMIRGASVCYTAAVRALFLSQSHCCCTLALVVSQHVVCRLIIYTCIVHTHCTNILTLTACDLSLLCESAY